MLGFVSVVFAQDGLTPETDYDAIIATFAGFAGGIVLLVEGIKKLFPKMSGIWTQLVSWLTGIVAVMLLYGLGSSLVANGIADTGFVQWIIGLFAKKAGGK